MFIQKSQISFITFFGRICKPQKSKLTKLLHEIQMARGRRCRHIVKSCFSDEAKASINLLLTDKGKQIATKKFPCAGFIPENKREIHIKLREERKEKRNVIYPCTNNMKNFHFSFSECFNIKNISIHSSLHSFYYSLFCYISYVVPYLFIFRIY